VLIPVFALGRAQELCILLDSHWERMNITVPIYFAAGLTEKANYYYKLFVNWTNQKIKETFVQRYAHPTLSRTLCVACTLCLMHVWDTSMQQHV
jgi:Cft2 family RNA processing exonuclease